MCRECIIIEGKVSKYKAVKTNGFDSGLEDRFHTSKKKKKK